MQVREQFNQKAARGAELEKPPLRQMFTAQIIVLLLGSAVLLLVDKVAAYSVLIGGLVAIGPNAYFARWAFRFSGARAASDIAQSFYRGEAGKFLLTTLLFASVFVLIKPVNAVVIFLAYSVMLALHWFLALRFLNQ